jgi:hypothetical protein
MPKTTLNTAIDELRQSARDIGKLHNYEAAELLIYAGAYEALKAVGADAAIMAFAEALANLKKAGAGE